MKRILISDENPLAVTRVDNDCFRVQNGEVDLLLNYDAFFELGLKITALLHAEDSRREESDESESTAAACEARAPEGASLH